MRSVIEEIASAEQQADEIRQSTTVQARELTLKAKEDAQASLTKLENAARISLQSELDTAKQQGEHVSADLLAKLEQETDAICKKANGKMDQAVAYLLDKVTKTA